MAKRIRELYESGDMEKFAQAQNEMAADDIVQEWPQGTTPKMSLRRILKPGETWIIEGTIDYGDGIPVSAVSIVETGSDGKIVRQTDYFANPFEAPAWRKQWVEHMEPAGVR